MGTRTPNYDLYIPGQGEEAWDDEVGGNFTTIDAALQALADTIDGAVYQINNVTYVASNARWNGSAWNRVDTGRPAVRMMLNSTTGILEIATAAAGANPITWTTIQVFSATGLDMKSKKVYNLATPTAASDAATKAYIDGLIAALKLSQIAIDADKNWNGKSISNVGGLEITEAKNFIRKTRALVTVGTGTDILKKVVTSGSSRGGSGWYSIGTFTFSQYLSGTGQITCTVTLSPGAARILKAGSVVASGAGDHTISGNAGDVLDFQYNRDWPYSDGYDYSCSFVCKGTVTYNMNPAPGVGKYVPLTNTITSADISPNIVW